MATCQFCGDTCAGLDEISNKCCTLCQPKLDTTIEGVNPIGNLGGIPLGDLSHMPEAERFDKIADFVKNKITKDQSTCILCDREKSKVARYVKNLQDRGVLVTEIREGLTPETLLIVVKQAVKSASHPDNADIVMLLQHMRDQQQAHRDKTFKEFYEMCPDPRNQDVLKSVISELPKLTMDVKVALKEVDLSTALDYMAWCLQYNLNQVLQTKSLVDIHGEKNVGRAVEILDNEEDNEPSTKL